MYDDCDVTSHCPDVSHAAQARPDALMGLATYSIEQYMYADLGRIAYPLRAALLHTRRAAHWRWVPVDGRCGTRCAGRAAGGIVLNVHVCNDVAQRFYEACRLLLIDGTHGHPLRDRSPPATRCVACFRASLCSSRFEVRYTTHD